MADTFDDESGDDLQPQILPNPPQSENNSSAAKKKAGRPKAGVPSSASKGAQSTSKRGAAEDVGGKTTSAAGRRKAPLKEIANEQTADSDAEEVDELDALAEDAPCQPAQTAAPLMEMKAPPKKGRKAKAGKQAEKSTTGGERRAAAATAVTEIPETQEDVSVSSNLAQTKPKASKPPRPAKRDVVPETQPEPMDVDDSNNTDLEGADSLEEEPPAPRQRNQRAVAWKASRLPPPVVHRRGGSASDTERGSNDASSRRKLSEMTAKLESLQLKYQDLKEITTRGGDSNFDKLKKQSDDKTAAADALIASLRSDLARQTELASKTNHLVSYVAELEKTNNTVTAENKSLKTSLTESQNEIKALHARLSAHRGASHPTEASNGKGPGSAIKTAPKALMAGSAEAAHKRMLKEELYRDLTGLILRDVKSGEAEGEDVYDCIQTGRNGTLHFHLTTSSSTSSSDNPTSYEDAEYMYTPLLDMDRDRDLLGLLPDYLTDGEGICFPRNNAAKFYGRVVDCLTKRIEVADY